MFPLKKVFLDTNFISILSKTEHKHHSRVLEYFEYLKQNEVPLFCNAAVIYEYKCFDPDLDFYDQQIIPLPINFDVAEKAAEIYRARQQPPDDDSADTKAGRKFDDLILAGAHIINADVLLTTDNKMKRRYERIKKECNMNYGVIDIGESSLREFTGNLFEPNT